MALENVRKLVSARSALNYTEITIQGSCIAKGTYDHLILSGVDFMSLLHVAEEPDSALETEYEEEEGRSRSFSRQESGLEDTRGNLVSTVVRKDSSVVMERKLSISSTRKRKESILSDAVGSDLSIASKSARVKVFVSMLFSVLYNLLYHFQPMLWSEAIFR